MEVLDRRANRVTEHWGSRQACIESQVPAYRIVVRWTSMSEWLCLGYRWLTVFVLQGSWGDRCEAFVQLLLSNKRNVDGWVQAVPQTALQLVC